MSTLTAAPAAHQTARTSETAPPVRTVRWVDPAGHTVLAIAERKAGSRKPAYVIEDVYTVAEFDSPLGRAFHLTKHGRRGGLPAPEHDVLLAVNPQDCRCDCKGFEHAGRCRHVAGLQALIGAATIAPPAADDADPADAPF